MNKIITLLGVCFLISSIRSQSMNLSIEEFLINEETEIIAINNKYFISIDESLKNAILDSYKAKPHFNIVKTYRIISAERIEDFKFLSETKREAEYAANNVNGPKNPSEAEIYINISIIAGLTIFAGIMSGLTVGYLSIDDLELELKLINGNEKEKKNANKVLPILAKRHWLLVTLLLMNAAAMEALPIFLDDIFPEYLAIIISVTLVLLFGEIIPQALCTGANQINIAAFLAPLTHTLMYLTSPISYPISLLLDYCFGTHSKSRFINTDLKALIELHTHNALSKLNHPHKGSIINNHGKNPSFIDNTPNEDSIGLNEEQANLMIAALEIKKKCARDLMIKLDKTFMVDYDKPIDTCELHNILDKGFSRIPVYSGSKTNLLGILRIKQLVGVDFVVPSSIKDLNLGLKKPLIIYPETKLFDLLKEFRQGKSHMAVITPNVEVMQNKLGLTRNNSIKPDFSLEFEKHFTSEESLEIEGIITLEDIIENMINLEILDEDDYEKILKRRTIKNRKDKKPRLTDSKKYERLDTKKWAQNFISEESQRIENIIRESCQRSYKSKEPLLSKRYDSSATIRISNTLAKDHFNENLL